MAVYGFDKCKSKKEITPEAIGAKRDDWMPTASDVGAVPITGGVIDGTLGIKDAILYNTGDKGQIAISRNDNAYFLLDSDNFSTWSLPLSGGTLLDTLKISIGENLTEIHAYDGNAYLRATNATRDDYADLIVGRNMEPMYGRMKNGTYNICRLYGENNITCGTTEPTSLANGCIYERYE